LDSSHKKGGQPGLRFNREKKKGGDAGLRKDGVAVFRQKPKKWVRENKKRMGGCLDRTFDLGEDLLAGSKTSECARRNYKDSRRGSIE